MERSRGPEKDLSACRICLGARHAHTVGCKPHVAINSGGYAMLRALVLFAILALGVSASSAATVNFDSTELRIRMTSAVGLTHIQSFNRFNFSTTPVVADLTTRVVATSGRRPDVSGLFADTWTGIVQAQRVAPLSYTMFGIFLSPTPVGLAALTFLPNGTWTCSGDCGIYGYWRPNGQFYPSATPLTSGTYDVQRVPLPAAAGLLGIALLGIFAAGLRRRRP